jgi:hypothetical protein
MRLARPMAAAAAVAAAVLVSAPASAGVTAPVYSVVKHRLTTKTPDASTGWTLTAALAAVPQGQAPLQRTFDVVFPSGMRIRP